MILVRQLLEWGCLPQIGHWVVNDIFLVTSYCLLFFAQNSPLLFAKRTSNICSSKNQNTISHSARIGLKMSEGVSGNPNTPSDIAVKSSVLFLAVNFV